MNIRKLIQEAVNHHQKGNLQQAEQLCMKIIKKYPNNFHILNLLGIIQYQMGNFDSAVEYFRKSLRFNPTNAETLSNLGTILKEQGKLEEAISCYKKALECNPYLAMTYNNLGSALQALGQFDDAINNYKRALQIDSNLSEAYFNLGSVMRHKGQSDEAIEYYHKALNLNPTFAEAYCNLGSIIQMNGHLDEAAGYHEKALQFNPNLVDSYNNLGIIFQEKGNPEKAEAYYRHALQLNADFSSCYSNLLLLMHYETRHDPRTIFTEHLNFTKRFEVPLSSKIPPHANDKNPNRRLKIGYVSPDFKGHSVAYFIEPVIASRTREQFEVFCYSLVSEEDEVTKRLQGHADLWKCIVGMSDEQVAELIRKDAIDILVDLAGHTANNCILLFARKPAPVQVTWIGYPATTGLSTMDYKIVDKYTDPFGMTEQFYTEKLIRMPGCFLCYHPDRESPEVGVLPLLTTGHITFGSFNYFPKVSPETVLLWSKILRRIPSARLIMKAKSFADRTTCEDALKRFAEQGIGYESIELLSWEPSSRRHLDIYNRIDIGLDTFPYNGTTTTCEALWMGVPVITLAGNTHASRVGMSLLSNIGLPELITRTPDEYVTIAVNLANDLNKLKSLRESLRGVMSNSPLTNDRRFIADLENCYRIMWEHWCKSAAG